MKLFRYGARGQEKPGMIDQQGLRRDLSAFCSDLTPQHLMDSQFMTKLASLDCSQLPMVPEGVRTAACIGAPGKMICIGFNSKLHTQQLHMKDMTNPNEMMFFLKTSSAMCGAFDDIPYTRMMKKLDWEAELGLVIGQQGKYIPKHRVDDYILGYCCVNDLSDRYLQREVGDTQFTKGKNFDNAAPLGPYLVTKEDIIDPNQLQVKLWINGELRQDFNTRDYVHNTQAVVSYVSQYLTLYPGDIISMGSGPGNAAAWNNQFLQINDQIELEIEGLGRQKQQVIREV